MSIRRRSRRRLLALIPFRDEARFLPGFLRSLAPAVDGIVGIDDQSTDGSADILRGHPKVLEILTVPPGGLDDLEDAVLHRRLTLAARKYSPDWLLGVDADERVERGFRRRAETAMAHAEMLGADAVWVPFKEMWTDTSFRVDGIWGQKRKACLFKNLPDHEWDERRLHGLWASMHQDPATWPTADLRLYHLRMIASADREARVGRYRRLDPDHVLQAIGYDYLLDESGLEVELMTRRRAFDDPTFGASTRATRWRRRLG